jgi:hypothetical protein
MTTKKPLFPRTAWTSFGADVDAEEPVFGRQNIYNDLLAVQRKEKKENREKKDKERRSKEKTISEEPRIPPPKKRRISKENDDSDEDSDSASRLKSKRESTRRLVTPQSDEELSAAQNPPRKRRTSPTRKEAGSHKAGSKKQDTTVITLDEDSDDEEPRTKASSRSSPKKPAPSSPKPKEKPKEKPKGLFDSEDEDDPYLQQLKEKARERQRQQRLESPADQSKVTPTLDLKSPTPTASATVIDDDFDAPAATLTSSKSAPAHDPEVDIFIKPLIPNTRPLIVTRRASQDLGTVKTYWCKKQNLSDAEAAKVFFIWREIKLFNSSTMRHIVDRLKQEEKVGQKPAEGRIMIEAVTQEILDQAQLERAKRKWEQAAITNVHDLIQHAAAAPPLALPDAPEKPEKFIIKLQNKDYGELPTRVRPTSTAAKLVRGYVGMKAQEESRQGYLIFDGVRVEDEVTVEELELEEGDVLEISFK